MTERMQQLHDISLELKQVIEKMDRANRDEMLLEMNELIGQRESLIKKVTEPYTEDEKKLGQKIVKLNDQIQALMDKTFTDVKNDILQIKQNKDSNMSYINPYRKTETTDGVYLDSRK